jgi:hypothetical protein
MRASIAAAALAQSVEHWIVIPVVTGSIPVCRPKDYVKPLRNQGLFRFWARCSGDFFPVAVRRDEFNILLTSAG